MLRLFFQVITYLIFSFIALNVLQGKGAHGTWILVSISLFVLHYASPPFRRKFKNYLGRIKQGLGNESLPYEDRRKALWRGAFIFVFLPHLFLFLINGSSLSSFDNYGTLQTAASIVQEGNLEISEYSDPNAAEPYYTVKTKRHGLRSSYPLGMTLPLTSLMVLSRLAGAKLQDASVQWRLSKLTASIMACLSLCMFFVIGCLLFSFRTSLQATFLIGLGSVFFSTLSQGLWTHGGVILAWLSIVYLQLSCMARKSELSWKEWIGMGFFFQWAFVCRLNAIAIMVPLFFWVLAKNRFSTFKIVLVSLAFFIPVGLYFHEVYGSPFGPQITQKAGFNFDFWQSLKGVLYSPSRGLLVYQPWILFFVPLTLFLISRKTAPPVSEYRNLCWVSLSGSVFCLVLISSWSAWTGGYCYGSRLMAESIPLFGILSLQAVDYLDKKHSYVFWFFFLLSFLLHIPAVYFFAGLWDVDHKLYPPGIRVDPNWDWSDPPFLYPFRKWFHW